MRLTYHLVQAEAWAARAASRPYHPASLDDEGFVHCTDGTDELVATANRYYREQSGEFVVLTIDLDALGVPWRFDGPDRRYPHVYGPIPAAAICATTPIERDRDGRFVAFRP